MFWDTQVMAEGIKFAEKFLGSQGRYLSTKDVIWSGVGLYTKNAGKFWYGDFSPVVEADYDALRQISRGMNETVYVIPDSAIDDARPFHEQALLEVTFSQ